MLLERNGIRIGLVNPLDIAALKAAGYVEVSPEAEVLLTPSAAEKHEGRDLTPAPLPEDSPKASRSKSKAKAESGADDDNGR